MPCLGTDKQMTRIEPRDAGGRILSRRCPDPNCGGTLRPEDDGFGFVLWRCDGLNYETDAGPLIACDYEVLPIAVQRVALSFDGLVI